MSETEKPLHVRVAEALGWTAISFATEGNLSGWGGTKEPCWVGTNPNNPPFCNDEIPRYDTDWAATGPLVEKYRIGVSGVENHWWATWDGDKHQCSTCGHEKRNEITAGLWISGSDPECPTPLIAICHLLLNMHAAGKL